MDKFYTEEHMQQQAKMLRDRVRKNYKRLAKKFRSENVEVFRLYHWDIPEIRLIVDWYAGELVVSEYVRQQTEDPAWLELMVQALADEFQLTSDRVYTKKRRTRPQKGLRYKRLDSQNELKTVSEGELKFLVNLSDYLDTGLFADHRITRKLVAEASVGKDLLNLYAYTASFSVYAAKYGARSSVSVDSSAKYLDWAKENFKLNDLETDPNHQFVVSDCFRFLEESKDQQWDVMIIDPPSFSTSPTHKDFDILEDHPKLLRLAKARLKAGGSIFFSTNHQRFQERFPSDLGASSISEITHQTTSLDYQRQPVHRCFRIDFEG